MGWSANDKNQVCHSARMAAADRRTVFTLTLTASANDRTTDHWDEAIETVEAEGWLLAHWSVTHDRADRPVAYSVFRRHQ